MSHSAQNLSSRVAYIVKSDILMLRNRHTAMAVTRPDNDMYVKIKGHKKWQNFYAIYLMRRSRFLRTH